MYLVADGVQFLYANRLSSICEDLSALVVVLGAESGCLILIQVVSNL